MNVITAQPSGGPDVLRIARRPVPSPGPGEVLIQVHAAGVNGADLREREGKYPVPPGAPDGTGYLPSRSRRSAPFTPAACTLISTSPGRGDGTSRCVMQSTSGPPGGCAVIAFMTEGTDLEGMMSRRNQG